MLTRSLFAGWWYNQHWCYCLSKCKFFYFGGDGDELMLVADFSFSLFLVGGSGIAMEFHLLCTLHVPFTVFSLSLPDDIINISVYCLRGWSLGIIYRANIIHCFFLAWCCINFCLNFNSCSISLVDQLSILDWRLVVSPFLFVMQLHLLIFVKFKL